MRAYCKAAHRHATTCKNIFQLWYLAQQIVSPHDPPRCTAMHACMLKKAAQCHTLNALIIIMKSSALKYLAQQVVVVPRPSALHVRHLRQLHLAGLHLARVHGEQVAACDVPYGTSGTFVGCMEKKCCLKKGQPAWYNKLRRKRSACDNSHGIEGAFSCRQ